MESIEQVKVKVVEEKEFTDSKTGEVKKYYRCEGESHSNGYFVFSAPYEDSPKVDDIYSMYITKDRYLKAVVRYRKVK